MLTSRAACHMATGDVSTALGDLERAVDLLDGVDRAVAVYQRSSILVRLNDDRTAATDLDRAISVLTRGKSRLYEAHARTNRGLMHTYAGQFGTARVDLVRARRLYLGLGIVTAAAKSLHNLAFLDTRCGDIVAALERFDQARREFETIGLDRGVLDLDCCDALLAAGLPSESMRRASEAADALRDSGNMFELPEAQLLTAIASQRCGDLVGARSWASAAAAEFKSLGRTSWADLAELVQLSCTPPDPSATAAALDLADRLEAEGLPLGAMQSLLLASEMLFQRGLLDEARLTLAHLRRHRLPPDLRLGLCDLEARLAEARGSDVSCRQWIRRGSRVLDRYQRSFASAEIRWSVTTHARGLLQTNRELAYHRGSSTQLFRSIELARANAIRRAPLERPDDPDLSRMLGELRNLTATLREPLDPQTARAALARQLVVQRSITERERALPSSAKVEFGADVVTLNELRSALGTSRLVQLDVVRDEVVAVCVDRRRTSVRHIGSSSAIAAMFAAAALAISRLARGTTGARSEIAAVQRLDQIGRELDRSFAQCWTPGVDSVVLVPPADLHAAAWAVLPSLSRIRFTVAASATLWARSRRHLPSSPTVVLVAGAHLDHAMSEVRAIAGVHAERTIVIPSRATANRVMRMIDGAWLVHLATHHHLRPDNPLFGSFELADGPLYLHDLLRVRRLPHVVVLSACEAAKGTPAPGGDVLGTSTVLMERGTATVIANASLVSDSGNNAAPMLDLHRRLALGEDAAGALRALRIDARERPPRDQALISGFTCFGAGW